MCLRVCQFCLRLRSPLHCLQMGVDEPELYALDSRVKQFCVAYHLPQPKHHSNGKVDPAKVLDIDP